MARGVATLIVNPAAGRFGVLRERLPAVAALLATHGYRVRVLYTGPEANSGRELARGSLDSALILACGGDGTVHDVLQGVAHTGVALGVLPLGTANALARNLLLPRDPVGALTRLLRYTARTLPLGEVTNDAGTRWFTVLAGCGPDGALAHTMPAGLKRRLGRGAYYAHAARLFATRRWPEFEVEYLVDGEWHTARAVALLVSRVADLGGLFAGLTPGARLDGAGLHVQMVRGPGYVSLPAWFGLSRVNRWNPMVRTVEVMEVRCRALGAERVYAQVDAEAFGGLPLRFRVVADGLKLLMP